MRAKLRLIVTLGMVGAIAACELVAPLSVVDGGAADGTIDAGTDATNEGGPPSFCALEGATATLCEDFTEGLDAQTWTVILDGGVINVDGALMATVSRQGGTAMLEHVIPFGQAATGLKTATACTLSFDVDNWLGDNTTILASLQVTFDGGLGFSALVQVSQPQVAVTTELLNGTPFSQGNIYMGLPNGARVTLYLTWPPGAGNATLSFLDASTDAKVPPPDVLTALSSARLDIGLVGAATNAATTTIDNILLTF
jgi:hypothetical protein